MAWIESHQEPRNHPKTRKAARMQDGDTERVRIRPNADSVTEARAILITYGALWFETLVG